MSSRESLWPGNAPSAFSTSSKLSWKSPSLYASRAVQGYVATRRRQGQGRGHPAQQPSQTGVGEGRDMHRNTGRELGR
jgi:hypothetical protein